MSLRFRTCAIIATTSAMFVMAIAATAASLSGETVYTQRCASCHDNPVERTPPRAQLRRMLPEDIVAALTKGAMQPQATGLSDEEIRGLAGFVSARQFGDAQAIQPKLNLCAKPGASLAQASAGWMGWGYDLENTRYQPKPGFSAKEVARLKPKWAYAFTGRSALGQPTIFGDRVFVTHASGRVSALDAKTGCEYWNFETKSNVRTPVVIVPLGKQAPGKHAAIFGTYSAIVYAIDVETGAALWNNKVDDHAVARLTGAAAFRDGIVYVPVSSHEETVTGNEKYACCTFRGAIVALEAATGKLVWKSFGIPGEPKPLRTNSGGTQMFGPAGGAIWSAPTIDIKRGLIYAATGNSYTDADTEGGNDSIVAFELKTGKRVWASQVTPKDNFVLGCGKGREGKGNCPEDIGPDHDFGSSPLLRTLPNGKQIIVAGQKSGIVYGLDPDQQGKVLWQTRIGQGSALGGVEWGFSADLENAYVPVSDLGAGESGTPGLYALNLATGKQKWAVPTPKVECGWTNGRCARAQAAASTTIPGVVFSGAFDGHLRGYATQDGAIVWDYDTSPAMETVNGVRIEGGSIDATGATIADGTLYIASGYGSWGKSGRLLIAFSVDGK